MKFNWQALAAFLPLLFEKIATIFQRSSDEEVEGAKDRLVKTGDATEFDRLTNEVRK